VDDFQNLHAARVRLSSSISGQSLSIFSRARSSGDGMKCRIAEI
jgi:hypothetical protein